MTELMDEKQLESGLEAPLNNGLPRSTLAVPEPPTGLSSRSSVLGDNSSAEKGLDLVKVPTSPRDVHGIAWILVVLAILSSAFLFALDNTIVADVQPAIIERFNSVSKLPWLSVSFFLGAVGTNLMWGKIFGQFNAKWLYILTVFIFEVGSAVCGAAPNMNALIVGRAICGLGGSGMYVGVMTLLSVTTTEHERPMYIGLTGITWGLGTVLGPIIGGAFTDSGASWRWAFYINLCVGGLFAFVYIVLLPSYDPQPGVSIYKRVSRIDWLGTILVIGGFTSGIMAISFGGNVYAWHSARIIALFVISPIIFTLFALQQRFLILTNEEQRLFPVQFLKSRTMLILFACMAAGATSVFVGLYFIPLYFQFVHGDSALKAGVRLLPLVAMLVFFCVANGAIMSMTGWYFPWYTAGGIFVVIAGALLFTVDQYTSPSKLYGYSVLLGIGGGAFIQAGFSVAQAKVEKSLIPQSIGFLTFGQVGGGTIALSIANSVFLNESKNKLVKILPNVPASVVEATIAGVGSTLFKSLDEATRTEVLKAIVDSISKTYILIITAGALTLVLSLFMRKEKLFMAAGGAA